MRACKNCGHAKKEHAPDGCKKCKRNRQRRDPPYMNFEEKDH